MVINSLANYRLEGHNRSHFVLHWWSEKQSIEAPLPSHLLCLFVSGKCGLLFMNLVIIPQNILLGCHPYPWQSFVAFKNQWVKIALEIILTGCSLSGKQLFTRVCIFETVCLCNIFPSYLWQVPLKNHSWRRDGLGYNTGACWEWEKWSKIMHKQTQIEMNWVALALLFAASPSNLT